MCGRQHGKPDDEVAAEAGAWARGGDRAAVQHHQLAGECQTDAEAAAAPRPRAIGLREQVEHALELLGGDTNTAVAHANDDVATLAAHRQPDFRIGRAVLRGVVEQVTDDLRQADRIGVE